MKYVQGLNLKDWFDDYVGMGLGLNPASTSPQPVHVLNGLFHQSLTGRRMTRFAADLVAAKDGVWQVSQEELRNGAAGTVELPSSDNDLDDLRRAVAAMAASDRAVFRNNHSFQVAHIGMISSDTVHFGLGTLAAALITKDPVCRSRLSAGVKRLATPQPNPHWGLQRALIDESAVTSWTVDDAAQVPRWTLQRSTKDLHESLTGLLARALELLDSDCDSLLSLQVLANAATWTGLIAYAQVPSLSVRGQLHPLLMECTPPGDLTSLRDASSEGLVASHLAFENWLADGLADSISKEFDGPCSDEQAQYFLETTEGYKLTIGRKIEDDVLLGTYLGYLQNDKPIVALSNTLRDALVAGMGSKHRAWCHAVGRHCGFIGPRRGRMPRVRAEVALLPTLALAGMPRERTTSLLMTDWLHALEERFGIVVGPGATARSMHPRATEEDLTGNQSELARLLATVGLARRYSDGVTEVLDPRTLWATK